MAQIFISYSREDTKYAHKLAQALQQHAINYWIDERIETGERWFTAIGNAIRESTGMVVIMTPSAEKSEWVEKEILLAKRHNLVIYPLLLDGNVFEILIDNQYEDVRGQLLPSPAFFAKLAGTAPPASAGWQQDFVRSLKKYYKFLISTVLLLFVCNYLFTLGSGNFVDGLLSLIPESPTATPAPTLHPDELIRVDLIRLSPDSELSYVFPFSLSTPGAYEASIRIEYLKSGFRDGTALDSDDPFHSSYIPELANNSVNVSIDGANIGQVDTALFGYTDTLYTDSFRQVVGQTERLLPGEHTLTVSTTKPIKQLFPSGLDSTLTPFDIFEVTLIRVAR